MSDRTDATLPPDDPARHLSVADPDDPKLRHVSVAGGTYTILISSAQTAGRYCLIEMLVPSGSGPPRHRHDFEEMFTVHEGEIELTFRDGKQRAAAGVTVNIPSNAPHSFKSVSEQTARLLCLCSPGGQDEFFLVVGDRVESRTAPPPKLSDAEKVARGECAKALAPQYRTEMA